MKRPNYLAGLELDRASSLRSSPEKLEEAWRRPDTRWFTREQIQAGDGVALPSTISIARRLIEDWLTE